MLTLLLGLWSVIKGPVSFGVKLLSNWAAGKVELQQASQEAKIAEITAKTQLAAYKIQSDMNWDLAWAGQSSNTWKDEYLLILWSIFLWPAVVALPLDAFLGTHYMDSLLGIIARVQLTVPDVMGTWLTGWGIIFAAVYANKAAGQVMMGTRVSKIAQAFESLPDEVPDEVAQATTAAIQAKLAKRPARNLMELLSGKRAEDKAAEKAS